MRWNICEFLFGTRTRLLSGSRIEEMSVIPFPSLTDARRCENVKSRKNPDVQCPYSAVNGDFCSRHSKHPHRFVNNIPTIERRYTRKNIISITKIQKAWRMRSPFLRILQQGLGYFNRALSCNDTELYSLEPIESIPKLYYFSMLDSAGRIWSFDIRSLGQILSIGNLKQNPYNREPLSVKTLQRIHSRIGWLRKRKYSILHPIGVELTPEQHWSQKVLDLCMKIESFGYHISCDWFNTMDIEDHQSFYKMLYELWTFRLGLTAEDRDRIAPGHNSRSKPLFRINPANFRDHMNHSKHWWEKLNAYLIEFFLTNGIDKEYHKLGAMYCVMAFVEVNEEAAESFPWLVAN